MHEVASWLAAQLGVSLLAEGATSGRVGSKRCSNELARETGWQPKYPSFAKAMPRCWAQIKPLNAVRSGAIPGRWTEPGFALSQQDRKLAIRPAFIWQPEKRTRHE